MYRRARRRTAPATATGAAPDSIADDSDIGIDTSDTGSTAALTAIVAADASELSGLRSQVVEFGRRHGADDDLTDDLELLVSELATNVVRHTDETEIKLSISVDDGEATANEGDQPGIGRVPVGARRRWTVLMSGARSAPVTEDPTVPAVDQVGGRGLVIVHAIADKVVVGGNTVRCTLVR